MINSLYEPFRHWSEKGTIWIISDTHFNEDDDLRRAYPNRPTTYELVKRINAKVGKADTLLLLGDVGDPDCASILRGYKVLVMGNHDRGAQNYRGIFNEIYEGALTISEKIILSHEPLNIDWAFNFFGHCHDLSNYISGGLNVCADVIDYTPINFNQFLKSGRLKEIVPLHRRTIDRATERKQHRELIRSST